VYNVQLDWTEFYVRPGSSCNSDVTQSRRKAARLKAENNALQSGNTGQQQQVAQPQLAQAAAVDSTVSMQNELEQPQQTMQWLSHNNNGNIFTALSGKFHVDGGRKFQKFHDSTTICTTVISGYI
jgi:hypothetical protein